MRPSRASEAPEAARWMAPPRSKAELLEFSIADAGGRSSQSAAAEAAAQARQPAVEDARLYNLPEVAVLLGTVVVCLLLLESEGLLTWAQRMEVSPAQSTAVSALSTAHAALESLGLGYPRRVAIAAADKLAGMLGAQDDPLLAGGWGSPAAGLSKPSDEPAEIEANPPEERHLAPKDERRVISEPAAEGQRTSAAVLLLGDSMMAGSLGSAIALSLSSEPKPRLVRAVQTATGLSRPDVFDWMKVVSPLLERETPQLVVCSLGANDATNIRQGDRVLEFGRAGWRSAYAGRVKAMMQMLTAHGARVLWVGLPPMRNASFSEKTRYLNRIFAQAASDSPGVEYLEVELLVARNGEYATFMRSSEGRFVRVRMDDGVHYSPSGAKLIARWVVDWIDERRGALFGAAR